MTRRAAILTILLGSATAQAADLPEESSASAVSAGAAAEVSAGVAEGGASAGMAQAGSAPGMRIFATCRNAIDQWARPFAPVDMDVVSLGPIRRQADGTRSTTLFVRIVYDVEGGQETRKADVECSLDRNDAVAVVPTMR